MRNGSPFQNFYVFIGIEQPLQDKNVGTFYIDTHNTVHRTFLSQSADRAPLVQEQK